ncbi:MAG: twitching motility protein [Thermodesulfobacteriota bacterium]
MAEVTLADNQAAVILTASKGDIEVDIAYDGNEGLAGRICKAMAIKLIEDENFRDDLLNTLVEPDESA